MTDDERAEIVRHLSLQAEIAHKLADTYEAAAETVAGFRSEEEYQAFAADAFAAAQESIDAWPELAR